MTGISAGIRKMTAQGPSIKKKKKELGGEKRCLKGDARASLIKKKSKEEARKKRPSGDWKGFTLVQNKKENFSSESLEDRNDRCMRSKSTKEEKEKGGEPRRPC